MNIVEQAHLLENLESLLERQKEIFRRGDLRRLETLVEQATPLIEKIAESKCFERPEFKRRYKDLEKLYKTLELMLTSSKDSVSGQLKQAGNVRKTLAVYHSKS